MLFFNMENVRKTEQVYKKLLVILYFFLLLCMFVFVASESLKTNKDIEFQYGSSIISTKGNELLFIGETKEYIFIYNKVLSKPIVYNKSHITYWSYSKR